MNVAVFWRPLKTHIFIIMLPHHTHFFLSLFKPQEPLRLSKKPKNMGTCPIRCQSNLTILENPAEPVTPGRLYPQKINIQNKNKKNDWTWFITVTSVFISAAHQDTMIVSLYDYPSFGHTELTMCIGEQLTILSEYVINVSSPPLFSPRHN